MFSATFHINLKRVAYILLREHKQGIDLKACSLKAEDLLDLSIKVVCVVPYLFSLEIFCVLKYILI
jgi:hypothetical protein